MLILTYYAKVSVAIGHHAADLGLSFLLLCASGQIIIDVVIISSSEPTISICLGRQWHELFLFALIKLDSQIATDCEQPVPFLLN